MLSICIIDFSVCYCKCIYSSLAKKILLECYSIYLVALSLLVAV